MKEIAEGNCEQRIEGSANYEDAVGAELEAANEAMNNDLILLEILSHLQGPEDAKKFRLLNSKCFELGSVALLKGIARCEHLQSQLHLDHKNMSEAEWEFLRLNGSSAKRAHLILWCTCEQSFAEDCTPYAMLNHLFCLEELRLENRRCYHEDEGQSYTPTLLELPTLKIIDFTFEQGYYYWLTHCHKLVREILKAAPNLEDIRTNVDALPCISEANKGKVKSLIWTYIIPVSDEEEVKSLSALTSLTVEEAFGIPKSLVALLEANKDTLSGFDIRIPFEEGPTEQNDTMLPQLGKVKTLSGNSLYDLAVTLDPDELLRLLPNIETVVFGSCSDDTHIDLIEPLPHEMVIMTSVRRVEMRKHGIISLPFPRIEYVFPCLREIKVNSNNLLNVAYTNELVLRMKTQRDGLWLLPETVSLIELDELDLSRFNYYGLDSFFTGIPQKVCKDMQNLKKDAIPTDSVREFGRISNLRNLKLLKLSLMDQDLDCVGYYPIVTHISRWCALDLLPDLKLEIIFPGKYLTNGKANQGLELFKLLADISTFYFK